MAAGALDADEICKHYGSSILRRARGMLGDWADAEDATQEVFVAILRHRDRFRHEALVSTWIYRITTNVCLNRLKVKKRHRAREVSTPVEVAASSGDPYAHCDALGLLASIVRTFDALSQQVFVLTYMDGMTQDDVAGVVGKSRKTVGKRLAQLQTHLRRFEEG